MIGLVPFSDCFTLPADPACWVTSVDVQCHFKTASPQLLGYICTVQVPKYNPLVSVCYAFVSVAHPQRK